MATIDKMVIVVGFHFIIRNSCSILLLGTTRNRADDIGGLIGLVGLLLAFHGPFFRRHLRPNYLVAYPGEDRLYRPRKLTINPAKGIGNAT
jgi:hypothetical protein